MALLAAAGAPAAFGQPRTGSSDGHAYDSAGGRPEQGKRIADAQCTACHGADGNSPNLQFPKLAGQNPAYLYGQLRAFKTGARRSEVMESVVAGLSSVDAADLASFYARQTIKPDPVRDRALARDGQRVFFGRTDSRSAPPCATCHGSAGQGGTPMMGMMGRGMMGPMMGPGMMGGETAADVPGISGQHAAYIVDQLDRFASGQRESSVMSRIAAALSPADEKAVAVFLSGIR